MRKSSSMALKSVTLKKVALTLALMTMAMTGSVTAPAAAQFFSDVINPTGLGPYIAVPGDHHGPGGIFADLDGDGFPDLYLLGAPDVTTPSIRGAVYRNVPGPTGARVFQRLIGTGDGSVSTAATGAVACDFDNDDDLDILVTTFVDNIVLENQLSQTGVLSFLDITAATDPTPLLPNDLQDGLARAWEVTPAANLLLNRSLSAACADIDRDGWIDVYIANHRSFWTLNGSFNWVPAGLPPGTPPGQQDVLYRNNGIGPSGTVTFTDITNTASIGPGPGVTGFEDAAGSIDTVCALGVIPPVTCQHHSSSNAAMFADFNNDQWPDLLVTNKVVASSDRDMIYINQGNNALGVWQGYAPATYTMPGTFGNMSPGAMGVDVGDYDNDGDFDIAISDAGGVLLTDPSFPPWLNSFILMMAPVVWNDIWVNQLAQTGVLSFVHNATAPGVWSWGTQFIDLDNDGDLELHYASSSNNFLYLNGGGGILTDVSAAAGVAVAGDHHGSMSADYNRDGWTDYIDIYKNSNSALTGGTTPQPSSLFQNNVGRFVDNHHLSLLLKGDSTTAAPLFSSRDALGARVEVWTDVDGNGTIERQIREVVSGSSNAASTSSLELEFGLGTATKASLRIFWPSGRVSSVDLEADFCYRIDENPFQVTILPITPAPLHP